MQGGEAGATSVVSAAQVVAEEAQREEANSPKEAASPSALVIVGPSGVGKGTLIKLLMSGSEGFGFCVSHTTRSPRPGEEV